MEIRNLYTFLQVASLQNFTKASQILGYSQSNVSSQIQQLEEDVGVKLFDRIGRGVILTQYGQQLVPYAEQIILLASKMDSMLWMPEDMIGILRLGMIESVFDICFEQLILRYTERFPKVKIDLTIEGTLKQLEMLKKGQLDVACLIDDPLPCMEWNSYYKKEVEIVVVAGRQNHLTQEKDFQIEKLNQKKFILMEDATPYNEHFYHALASHAVEIQPFLTLQSARMARHIVEDSEYLSYLPLYVVQQSISTGEIVPLRLQDYAQVQDVQLVVHNKRILTPHIQGFLDIATAVLEEAL